MSKHTPGPWFATQFDVSTPFGTQIADCVTEHNRNLTLEERAANAALIAAAPEMLEALRIAARNINADSGHPQDAAAYEAVRAAIAKAEGRQ